MAVTLKLSPNMFKLNISSPQSSNSNQPFDWSPLSWPVRKIYPTSSRTFLQPPPYHWLCLHKPEGVYLQCQDQCCPQINNFLGNQYANRPQIVLHQSLSSSFSPWFYPSPQQLRPFSLPVKLMAVIFSWAVSDTSFAWLSVSRLLLSRFFCLSGFNIMLFFLPGQGTQPHTSSFKTTALVIFVAVNISWTSPFPGCNSPDSHTNISWQYILVPQFLSGPFVQLHPCGKTERCLQGSPSAVWVKLQCGSNNQI